MQTKKVSLFKQKIKQARSNQLNQQENQKSSFPKAVKINLQSKMKDQDMHEQSQNLNTSSQDENSKFYQSQQANFQQKLNFSSILNQNELSNIQSQNWNAVKNMSQQQRSNYINLIQSTFPKKFVNILTKKAQTKMQQMQTPKNNIAESKSKQQEKPKQKIEQEKSKSKITKHQERQKMMTQKDAQKQKDQAEQQAQSFKQEINKIKLNIKDNTLIYMSQQLSWTMTSQTIQSYVSISQIAEMIKSQNNQSQIIGSKLTLQYFKQLYKTKTAKGLNLIKLCSLPFHLNMCVIQVYEALLLPIQTALQKTTFISCFIEMIVNVVEIITIIKSELSQNMLTTQLNFIKGRMSYVRQTFKLQDYPKQQQQIKTTLSESLLTIFNCLEQQIKNRKEKLPVFEKINSLGDPKILSQIILLEACLNSQEKNIFQMQFDFVIKKCQNIDQQLHRLQMIKKSQSSESIDIWVDYLYQFICHLKNQKRLNSFYSPIIKSIMSQLVSLLELIKQILKFQVSQKTFYKSLFLIKTITNMEQMNNFISSTIIRQLHSQESSIIVYLNMSNYFCGALQNNQIQLLETMMKWIVNEFKSSHSLTNKTKSTFKQFFNYQQLFWDWIEMFIQPDQIYSLLDQTLLNQIFSYICQIVSLPLKLPTESLKAIVQNYNYNSFGNDVFTKFLFFIAVSQDQQVQRLILQENMMRYPMLFYYAFQEQQMNDKQGKLSTYGPQSLYIKTKNSMKGFTSFSFKSNASEKQQVLKLIQNVLSPQTKIKQLGNNTQGINKNNLFVRYILQPYEIKKQEHQKKGKYAEMF